MSWLLNATSAFDKLRNQAHSGDPVRSIYEIEVPGIDGNPMDLSSFKGKHLLIVNVASECGFTGQYKGLEELHQHYGESLTVLGVPCNQFGSQEPGSEQEIQAFCSREFRVSFPMTAKLKVKGSSQHHLYRWLTRKELNGVRNSRILWNFHKFLVGPDGRWLGSFPSTTPPDSSRITKHLEKGK